ncbi:MAG: 30S ribosome-binding factor RbfA [Nitrospinota bacterium]|nr:30S ribosome-binding factor RbfA [Nitrospinota bacterium]
MSQRRADRVGELIREEVARMVISGEIKDSRIGLVTITGFDISNDLKSMTIYVSAMGKADSKKDSLVALSSASRFVRGVLGKRLRMKRIPDLYFKADDSIEYSDKISRILNDLKKEDGGETDSSD